MPTELMNPEAAADLSEKTSELNNLLQIIGNTSEFLENIWEGNDGADTYFAMLRESIGRAAAVTAQLVAQAGGGETKVILHPVFAGAQRRAPSAPRPEAKRCILCVDDDPMLLVLADRILTEAGFHVVTAQSGFQCLSLFRRAPGEFDLVILDLSMPLMNGEETFRHLRGIAPNVRVVLSTGFIDKDRLEKLMSDGLCGLLRKPLSPQELVSHVNGLLLRSKLQAFSSN